MQIIQSRRDLLASLSAAGAAGLLGGAARSDDGPPETTTVRIRVEDAPPLVVSGVAANALCIAPTLITEDLLRAEGFTDIRYVLIKNGPPYAEAFAGGEVDFGLRFAPGAVRYLDEGVPITVLAGVHPGCFELFVHEAIRAISDLKGKKVGYNEGRGTAEQLYVSIMAAHVGLDPEKDIEWVTTDDVASPIDLFIRGKIDAYLAFVPEFPECAGRYGDGQAVVPVLLLCVGRKQRVCSELSDCDQTGDARHPQGHRCVRDGTGACRTAAGRGRLREALRRSAADGD
jgi:NitT/TauT family transport system substrate-binding protein